MLKKILTAVGFVIIAAYIKYIIDQNALKVPKIRTTSGEIKGLRHEHYYSFESIPYAKPPVDDLRFESPQPYKSDGIIDGRKSSPSCLQWNHMNENAENRVDGQEDCLYLNVYTPEIKSDKLYPIFVLIHGGAFMFGSSNFIREELIMKYKNAVVVSMNYRLGPLGFLSTEDDVISGNMGLKDQKLALKWIRENAKSFNGNTEQILLTGFSAGGASTHLHLLNKETKVAAAISFSGTANCPWVVVPKPLQRTKKLAESLNCSTESSSAIKECLLDKSPEEIVMAVKHFQPFLYFPFRVFGPVVESSKVSDAFLTKTPNEVMESGNFPRIPYLTTFAKDEGGYNAADLMIKNNKDEFYLEEFLEKFDELAPVALFYAETMNKNDQQKYSKHLIEKYHLLEKSSLPEKYYKVQDIFSDELFKNDILKTTRLHRDHAKGPIYQYMYENPAPIGVGNLLSHKMDFDFGTVHGDDVFLIYNLPARDEYKFRPDEEIISKKLINMMRNFAITGKLTYGDLEVPHNVPNSNKITYMKITREKTSIALTDDDLL